MMVAHGSPPRPCCCRCRCSDTSITMSVCQLKPLTSPPLPSSLARAQEDLFAEKCVMFALHLAKQSFKRAGIELQHIKDTDPRALKEATITVITDECSHSHSRHHLPARPEDADEGDSECKTRQSKQGKRSTQWQGC